MTMPKPILGKMDKKGSLNLSAFHTQRSSRSRRIGLIEKNVLKDHFL